MGGKRLLETVSCLSFIYFCCTIIIFITLTPSTVSAQAAVEYGTIIGSKTPPKTPNVMKSSEKISQKESSKASPKNGSKEKTSNQVKKLAPRVLDQLSSRNEGIVMSESIE